MKLYNTLTRTIEEFQPLDPPEVGLYTCGPTVYDYQHIGNYIAYIRWDILARTLNASGYKVLWYMNITDVGHLVSDDDTGEDKLEKGAAREGKTAWKIAEFYLEDFKDSTKKLNIRIPSENLVRATDHIDSQIEMVQQLEAKGYTYIINNEGVYFDTSKLSDYGKLARLDISGLQAGARVSVAGKRNITDFALWKFSPAGQKRDMEWDSPWGKGFPGWHVECSALAIKFLGETLDIHAGGIDHIPVHHTNEIAQSESATGKRFANVWMHSNFLQVEAQKISKSLGNGYTIRDLEGRGYSPEAFRIFALQSHYRSEAHFTWENLEAAQNRLKNIYAAADLRWQTNELSQSVKLSNMKDALLTYLQEDLNTPLALSILDELADIKQLGDDQLHEFETLLKFIDDLLGLKLNSREDITAEQKETIAMRENARKVRNWSESDRLRDSLLNEGISVRDTEHGPIWSRI